MNGIVETTDRAIRATVESMGYEIVDIEYIPKSATLTVYIDIPRGVSLDDCEAVHNAINPLMDEADPTMGKPYTLNVSSPGLDRPFTKHRDFERNYGREVEVKLYAPLRGKKLYEGVLVEKTDHAVVLETGDGPMTIEDTRIAFTRPLVRFE